MPYFEVDLDADLTTFFSVTNAADEPASFLVTVHTNWGIPVLTVAAGLDAHQAMSIDLAEWTSTAARSENNAPSPPPKSSTAS